MPTPYLGAEQPLLVGTETVVESVVPDGSRGVVFEDDGETGYFYALDFGRGEQPIVDALHVYNVQGVVDREEPSQVKVIWSHNFGAAALMINLVPYAVFDFAERVGYAESPFPEADPRTGWTHSEEIKGTRRLFFGEE